MYVKIGKSDNFCSQSVVSESDPRGQRFVDLGVKSHSVAHVGEERLPRLGYRYNVKRLAEVHVGGMFFDTESVYDQNVEILYEFERFGGKVEAVGDVSHAPDAESAYVEPPVPYGDGRDFHAGGGKGKTVDFVEGESGNSGIEVGGEAVGNAGAQIGRHVGLAVDGQVAAHAVAEGAQVVDSAHVVVVAVGEEHGVDALCAGAEHLLVEIGAAVYEDRRIAGLNEHRRAHAAVAGVGGAAHGAVA